MILYLTWSVSLRVRTLINMRRFYIIFRSAYFILNSVIKEQNVFAVLWNTTTTFLNIAGAFCVLMEWRGARNTTKCLNYSVTSNHHQLQGVQYHNTFHFAQSKRRIFLQFLHCCMRSNSRVKFTTNLSENAFLIRLITYVIGETKP